MSLRAWWQRFWTARTAPEGDACAELYLTPLPAPDDAESDPFNPFPEPIQLELTDIFDLHTVAPRDVHRAVAAYLHEAHRRGFRSVRLIHGKGRGVQRAAVRAILARTPFIIDWTDAPPAAGGRGATIAHLRPLVDGEFTNAGE